MADYLAIHNLAPLPGHAEPLEVNQIYTLPPSPELAAVVAAQLLMPRLADGSFAEPQTPARPKCCGG